MLQPEKKVKKEMKEKMDIESLINPLTGMAITMDGFHFSSEPIQVRNKLAKEVVADDPVIKSLGVVIEQYFGAYVLDDNDIEKVVDSVNGQKLSDWWDAGYCLHGELENANYTKSGKCPTSMEG